MHSKYQNCMKNALKYDISHLYWYPIALNPCNVYSITYMGAVAGAANLFTRYTHVLSIVYFGPVSWASEQ